MTANDERSGEPTLRFVRVAALDEIPEEGVLRVDADGLAIALVRANGDVHAMDDLCTHEQWPLSEGFVDSVQGRPVLVCALHGAEFCVRTGKALSLPAEVGVTTYSVRVEDGDVLVGIAAEDES